MSHQSRHSVRGHWVNHGRRFSGHQPVRSSSPRKNTATKGRDPSPFLCGVVGEISQLRESLELRFKDVLYIQPKLPFFFDRLTRTHVTHTDRVGMNGYLPDPLHITGSCAVSVE